MEFFGYSRRPAHVATAKSSTPALSPLLHELCVPSMSRVLGGALVRTWGPRVGQTDVEPTC